MPLQLRATGVTSGTSDTYFFCPAGKRYRSCAEIARHFRLDPSAPRKRPNLGEYRGAEASGGPPPQLLPPPVRVGSSPPGTSTDTESAGGGGDTESSATLHAADASEAAAALGEGCASQYAAPSAAEVAARRKSVTLAEYRAAEHARRVDEQAALVRALRAFFGSEPGLQGAPVFPAITPNLPGYRAAYGRWAEPASALARLLEVVAAEMASCAHLHETPSATWCKNKLSTVGKLVGLEDAEAFAAFTPGIRIHARHPDAPHRTALPAAAAPASSGEQVEELRWVPKSETAAALLHWLEAPGAANEGVWMSLDELDARYCDSTGAAPFVGAPWTHPIHVLFRAKYDCVSCAALDAVHRSTSSKKGSSLLRYMLGARYASTVDGPHWAPALASGTRDRKRVEPFSPPATPPPSERRELPPQATPPPLQDSRLQQAAVLKQCSGCRKELRATSFSNNQWGKGASKRRCKACIGEHLYAEPVFNPGPITSLGTDVYTVEALLAQRRIRGRREFLVRWQNWAPEHDTWEVRMTWTQPPASGLWPPATSHQPPVSSPNPSPSLQPQLSL